MNEIIYFYTILISFIEFILIQLFFKINKKQINSDFQHS